MISFLFRFFRFLLLSLIREFKEMANTFSFESRMELKLVHANRVQNECRDNILPEVQDAIRDFKHVKGVSKFIPVHVKTQAECYQYLKESYGESLKDLGLIITPKLKLKRF